MKLLSCIDGFTCIDDLILNSVRGVNDSYLPDETREIFSAEFDFLRGEPRLVTLFNEPTPYPFSVDDLLTSFGYATSGNSSPIAVDSGRGVFLVWMGFSGLPLGTPSNNYYFKASRAGAESISIEYRPYESGYVVRGANIDEQLVVKIFNTYLGVVLGHIELEPTKKAAVKHGKLRLRATPKHVISYPHHIAASHTRSSFYRTLRHPKYYKDGVVPADSNKLRRVRVKECKVTREINKFDAVRGF